MEDSAGPQVGQHVTVEVFDGRGKRIRWGGRVSRLEKTALEITLAPGDPALSMVEGTQAMVEHVDGPGVTRFMTTILEARLSNGLRLLVEAPPSTTQLKRRRFIRYPARVPVSCRVEAERRERFSTFTRELGGSGASLLAERHATSGTMVQLELDLGPAGACAASAQVKHSKKLEGARGEEYQWGVEFTEMDGKNLARLLAFLRTLQNGRAPR